MPAHFLLFDMQVIFNIFKIKRQSMHLQCLFLISFNQPFCQRTRILDESPFQDADTLDTPELWFRCIVLSDNYTVESAKTNSDAVKIYTIFLQKCADR